MANTLFVDIVAPDRKVYRGEATGVQAPGVQGSFEVKYNHAPMLAAFSVGPLLLRLPDGEVLTYATSGGFLEVMDNQVTVLAETVEPASEIDLTRAQSSEEKAREKLRLTTDPEERARMEAELERARNRVRLAMGKVGTR